MTETIDIQREVAERDGCRSITRARSTGTLVGIYDAVPAGLDPDGGRWVTLCEEHTCLVNHETLAVARRFASAPEEWCEFCAPIAEERALPAELRESDAYHDDPDATRKLWDNGYRPMPASDLRVGMTVAFVETMFGFRSSSEVGYARITRVEPVGDVGDGLGPWGYLVEHSGGNPAEVDEAEEVWAQ